MAKGDIPQGQRFSHVYLQRPDQLEDSERMRRRLGAWMHDNVEESLKPLIFRELGIVPVRLFSMEHWMKFYADMELRDALDSITIIVNRIKSNAAAIERLGFESFGRPKNEISRSISEIRRIFTEERTRYTVDDAGGVHLAVDQQFEVAKASAVQGMGDPRYAEALRRLEDGYKSLDCVPPDGRAAVRGVFDAAENLFKQMFEADRLVAHLIEEKLKPAVAALGWKPEAQAAGEAMVDALKDWVKAGHNYRHQAGRPDPHQPPLDLAILMVTQGTGFVRWLVTIDKAVKAAAVASPAP